VVPAFFIMFQKMHEKFQGKQVLEEGKELKKED
jgi:hypothetical protein